MYWLVLISDPYTLLRYSLDPCITQVKDYIYVPCQQAIQTDLINCVTIRAN